MKTPTKKMWDALEEQLEPPDEYRASVPKGAIFPKAFLVALRFALETGMSCQQITSMPLLQSTMYDLFTEIPSDTLIDRTNKIIEIMKRDIECSSK